jgi:hypothetical protein
MTPTAGVGATMSRTPCRRGTVVPRSSKGAFLCAVFLTLTLNSSVSSSCGLFLWFFFFSWLVCCSLEFETNFWTCALRTLGPGLKGLSSGLFKGPNYWNKRLRPSNFYSWLKIPEMGGQYAL